MIVSITPQTLVETLVKRLGLVLSKRQGLALAIWGEPGVGKSWAAGQILRQLPCQNVVVKAAVSGSQLIAALPKSDKLPVWVENALKRFAKSELEPAKAADALAAYLTQLAPFVLRVEDLHEATPEQARLWQELAQEITRTKGVGLLFTTRTPPEPPLEPYPLGSLSPEAATALLQGQVGASLPKEATDWIFARAQGNPLFSLEYFRHLTRLGHLWSDGQRWRWRAPETELMPTSVEALILQLMRGASLSEAAQAALEVLSLLPAGAAKAVWAKGAELSPEQLDQALLELEDRGLLALGEFVHPLFKEVIGRELPLYKRQQIARRLVEGLQAKHPQEATAFIEDAGLEGAKALDLLKRAAQVVQASQERTAANFLAKAAAYASGSERQQLALQAAHILRDFNLQEATRAAELALQGSPKPPQAIRLQAELLSALGRGEEAERLLGEVAPDNPEWLETLLGVRLGRYDYAGVLKLWEQNPQLHAEAGVKSLVYVGRALIQLGQFAQARDFLQQAMPGRPDLERAWLLSTYASIPLNEGDFAAAVESLNIALEALDKTLRVSPGFRQVENLRIDVLRSRSLAFLRWGQYSQAIADLEAYLHHVSILGDGRRYAEGQANLGPYLLTVGNYERAEEVLLESHSVWEKSRGISWLPIVEQELVRLYLEWTPPHGGALALKHAQAAEVHARQTQSPPVLAEALAFVSWAEAVHGQPQRASHLVEELLALAKNLGETRLVVFGHWVQGLALERLNRRSEALVQLKAAVEEMEQLGHKPFANRMALEIDRIQGDRKSAHKRIQLFEDVGNTNWANIARRYFPTQVSAPLPQAGSGLEINILGPMQLLVDGTPIEYAASKGREMLALLLESRLAGRPEVSGLDLLDSLYPEMDEDKAASALKQLVYRLRSTLGSHTITRTSGGYALGAARSDAEEFLQSGDTALWRGTYLQGIGEGWDIAVSDSLYHALRIRAKALLASDAEEALRLGRILLEADPYDAAALALCLQALQSVGNLSGAEHFYRQGRERFSEVGERLPESWEDFLLGQLGSAHLDQP